MGLITTAMNWAFGGGRNLVTDTAEVFFENTEHGAAREVAKSNAAMAQFAAEFAGPRKGIFDRLIDGVNRLPRPMLALGTLGLFVAAMADPVWFSERMVGVALIPEPLWWLMGAIVSFYFGARHQVKGQNFQRSVAQAVVIGAQMREQGAPPPPEAIPPPAPQVARPDDADNAALADWSDSHAR